MDLNVEPIVARLAAASQGTWGAYRMSHAERGDALTPEEIGEYVKNSVLKSATESGSHEFLFVSVEKASGAADVCHVGNGPTSPANADFIAHAPSDIAALLAELESLRAERLRGLPAGTGKDLSAEVIAIARGFRAEADNGVICTPRDNEWGVPQWLDAPHRTWCERCRSLWSRLFAVAEEFKKAAAAVADPGSLGR